MPISEDGTRAEVILNSFGIVSRLNVGQLYEQELNYINRKIVLKMKTLGNYKEKLKFFLDYMKFVNKKEYKGILKFLENKTPKERLKFIKEIERDGIYLHQPPFWNNIGLDRLGEIYDKYPWIKIDTCYVNGQKIQNPLIIAPLYLVRLRHEPLSKFSARSSAHVNLRSAPSKSLSYKSKNFPFSQNPLRVGEMETNNLLMSMFPNDIYKIYSMLSSSEENRNMLVEELYTENPLNLNIKLKNDYDNYNAKIFNVYLKSLGLIIEE